MHLKKRTVLYGLLALGLCMALWEATYPDEGDPKNIHYVAWKWHLLPIDPLRALGVMTHDRNSEHLVLGKTPSELSNRFGYVLQLHQVTRYLQECAAYRTGSEVLFLNKSDYMVVLTNNRATELVLCKGY
jgi:hypothetical protein